MPFRLNQIDQFAFMTLGGQLPLLRERLQIRERPGIDGTSKRLGGITGDPFRLTSTIDVNSIDEGRTLARLYSSLTAGDAVALIWNDYDVSLEGWLVDVLGVEVLELAEITGATPGLNYANPVGVLVCRWQLRPALIQPEED